MLDLAGERTPVGALVRDFVAHLGLLVVLARHDFRSKYRSTVLGVAWSVAVPLLQALVIALVFSRIVRIQTGSHYAVFVLSGIAVWSFFSQSLSVASTSIVDGGGVAGKVYFPRLILPLLGPSVQLVSLCLSLLLALLLAPALGVTPTPRLLLLPAVVVLAYVLVGLVGALASGLHLLYRDTRYLVVAALLVWLYATPVVYPLSQAHGYASYVRINPVTGVVELSHWCFLGSTPDLGASLGLTVGWIVVLLLVVLRLFAAVERTACDRL